MTLKALTAYLVTLLAVVAVPEAKAAKLKLELPEIQIRVIDKLGFPVPNIQVSYGGQFQQGTLVNRAKAPNPIPIPRWEKLPRSIEKDANWKWPIFSFASVTNDEGKAVIPAYKGEVSAFFAEDPVLLVHMSGSLTGFETDSGRYYSALVQIPINSKVVRVNGKITSDHEAYTSLRASAVTVPGRPIILEFELIDFTVEDLQDQASLQILHAKAALENGSDCESWLSTPSEKGAALVPFLPDAKLPNRR